MPTRNLILGMVVVCATIFSSQVSAQTTSVDPGRWAYPMQAVRQSNPPLIGDYVPCIFDLDQHGNFRSLKVPALETQMKTAALDAIQSSSLKPTQKIMVANDASQLMFSALTPQKIFDSIRQSAATALESDASLDAGGRSATSTAVANNVSIAAQQAGPIQRPSDVSCGMSVLPWSITRWSFGREIAENFIVVQVTVRNLNNEQQFLVHDVELAVDTQPGIFNRFSSSVDQATIDGVALTAEEGWSSRTFWLRLATLVGSIISAGNVPVSNTVFKDSAGIYTGAFIPGLTKFLKDHTSEQIARLDSAAFTNSQSRKVIVAKNDSATFDAFLPVQSLLQIDWEKIYLYKTNAKPVDPNSDLILAKKKGYKDWSPLALLGLNNSTYVILSGAHITETPSQAQISSLSCPPSDNTTIDLTKISGDTFTCNIKGTNLQVIAQVILENAQDPGDHVYAVGTPATAGADPTQATVAFNTKDLQGLKGTTYKVFYAIKGGTPQATSLSATVQQVVSISPTSLVFTSQTVGTPPSPVQSIALTNRGTATLSITGITTTGTNAGDFTETNTCGTSVTSGENCAISVTFKPTGTGSRRASLSIADNGPGSPHSVALTGTGAAALAHPQ